jgi:hypothetical protein
LVSLTYGLRRGSVRCPVVSGDQILVRESLIVKRGALLAQLRLGPLAPRRLLGDASTPLGELRPLRVRLRHDQFSPPRVPEPEGPLRSRR